MKPFCIVGHIKKYAKVQRAIENWENVGEVPKNIAIGFYASMTNTD